MPHRSAQAPVSRNLYEKAHSPKNCGINFFLLSFPLLRYLPRILRQGLELKEVLNLCAKHPGDIERQLQRGIIKSLFKSADSFAANTNSASEFCLAHFYLLAVILNISCYFLCHNYPPD